MAEIPEVPSSRDGGYLCHIVGDSYHPEGLQAGADGNGAKKQGGHRTGCGAERQ